MSYARPPASKMDVLTGLPWGEVSVVVALPTTFIVSAAISPLSDKSRTIWMIAAIVASLAAFFFSFAMLIRQIRRNPKPVRQDTTKIVLLPAATAALACMSRLPFLGDCPYYWDTCFYFNAIDTACTGFSFNPSSFLNGFRLCGHFSYGYGMIAGIGRYLTPGSAAGIQAVDMALLALALALLCQTVRQLLPDTPPFAVFLCVSLIGFEPLLYGTFGSINIDTPLVSLTILFLCAAHDRRFVLTAFLSLLIITTKEVGAVFVAFAALGEIIVIIRHGKERAGCLAGSPHAHLLGSLLISISFAAVLWVLVRLFTGGSATWNQGTGSGIIFRISYEPFSSFFDFFSKYFALVMKSVFVFNFAWLFTAVCVAGLLFELIWHKANGVITLIREHDELMTYYFGIIGLVVFNLLYYTINNVRYHAPIESALILLASLFILVHARRRWLELGLASILLTCCVVESFATVDPLTQRLFPHIETGRDETLVSADLLLRIGCPDTSAYNRQYFAQEHAIDEVLSDSHYGEGCNPDLIVWSDYGTANIYVSLSGGKSPQEDMGIRWNYLTHSRVPEESVSDSVPIVWMSQEQWLANQQSGALSQKAILIMPAQFYTEEVFQQAKAALSPFYSIDSEGMTSGGIRYLKMTLRN